LLYCILKHNQNTVIKSISRETDVKILRVKTVCQHNQSNDAVMAVKVDCERSTDCLLKRSVLVISNRKQQKEIKIK